MRGLRILLIIVVILGGLFVAADRAAVYFAESEIKDRIQISGGSTESKDVSIKGFPFLTQVVSGGLDEVEVDLKGVSTTTSGHPTRISTMKIQLHDVKLANGFTSATAARATGKAVISYEDLTKAADEEVSVAYGGNGKVKVTGTVAVMDRPVSRSVLSTVTLADGNVIRVHADKVPGEGIPGLEDLVRSKSDFNRTISGLPSGLNLEKVEVTPEGLEVSVSGTDVRLAG
ncbi:DUF2993 domain-containing protein [Streptomyces sp. DT24]|uniref:LmeA family phospholipid-binding protein n=1 Tax=unclassified Streptomyces TaxID=2593676 RepID=UPI0023B9DBB3|nr:DUF2993 domain-containing protein [Streptomyces sp. AM 4-1-1]WEH34265.1 DUF2993 domain-containing protein [Streptomyces sp. AM 4-1-1]